MYKEHIIALAELYGLLPQAGIHWNHSIRSSDNDSTGFWPPGSLHTLGADGHI